MMKMKKIFTSALFFLIIVLIIQGIMYISCGIRKKGLHIDEIYSYVLSNSYDTDRISNADIWDKWIEASDLMDFVTVQKGEGFAYGKVYYNNTMDAHPPLFYWALHTISSLFIDQFSIWFGLGINYIFLVFADIFLYLIGCRLLKNKYIAILPVLFWGLSSVCMDTAIFIRMYSLLTMFTLMYTWWSIKILSDKFSMKGSLVLYIICTLGCLTQYFFAVYAFFFTAIVCIWKLVRKRYKEMFLEASSVCVRNI